MKKDERIVSLIGLLKAILLKWRQVLLFSIVIAAVTAAFIIVKEYSSDSKYTVENETNQINYENEINTIENVINKKNEYIENSIIARMDSTNVATSIVTLSITTKEIDSLGFGMSLGYNSEETDASNLMGMTPALRKANRILNYYLRHFSNGMDWDAMAKKYETEPRFLNELVFVNNYNEELVTADLNVVYLDEKGALELLEYVQKQLISYSSEAKEIFGEHTVQFTNQLVRTQPETRYFSWMNDRLVELNNLATQKNNFKNNMQNHAIQEVANSSINGKALLKISLKYGILGFIVALLISIITISLQLIFTNTVLSGKEFNSQYQFNKIGIITEEEKLKTKKFDKAILKIDQDETSPEVSWKIAANVIKNMCDKESCIALIGDLDRDEMEIVKRNLEKDFDESEKCIDYELLLNLNSSLKSVRQLERCDAIVVVARARKSRYTAVNSMIETICAYNKRIIGSIVLE